MREMDTGRGRRDCENAPPTREHLFWVAHLKTWKNGQSTTSWRFVAKKWSVGVSTVGSNVRAFRDP